MNIRLLNSVAACATAFFMHSLTAAPMTVIVDPGHGGIDNGAVVGSHMESLLTLKVSALLYNKLKADSRFRAYLTREDNRYVSLSERARFAHNKKADVFVSIHMNSNHDPRARGVEFYFQNQLPPDQESMLLAHKENSQEENAGKATYHFLEDADYAPEVSTIVSDLLDSSRVLHSSMLSKHLKISWRGHSKGKTQHIRQAPFYVLSHMTLPSALVELGYLTNSQDLNDLTSANQQARMAEDIYRGLVAYKESMDKTSASQ